MKTREEYGSPFTLGEAKLLVQSEQRMNPYHREMTQWLIAVVEKLRPLSGVSRESLEDGSILTFPELALAVDSAHDAIVEGRP